MRREAGPKKQHAESKVLLWPFVRAGQIREFAVTPPGSGWPWSTPAASWYVQFFVRVNDASVAARRKDVETGPGWPSPSIQAGGTVQPGLPTEATIAGLLATPPPLVVPGREWLSLTLRGR